MKKPLSPRACMSHRLQSLVPWMAALSVMAHQGLWSSRSLRPTSSDMASATTLAAAASDAVPARTLYSLVVPAADEAQSSEVSPNALALPHEHMNRVNHLARARTLRELGDLAGALTECRRALYDAPEDTEALRTIARLGPLTGQTELAVLAQAQLGSLNPEDASPLVQQARLLLSQGRSTEAIRVGEEAVARDSEDPDAYQVLGRAQLAAGHLSEAVLRFEQAVHLAPEHGYALNNLGLAWLRTNENTKAAEVLARAAALLPHVAYVHNNLGVAYERLGRTEDAQAAYAAATRLSPRYVKAHVNASRMNKVASLGVSPP
ncbi:tetratricopeptide repeat protein [Hyalangium minutum]|uniref:Tetratricopeptide repeat protein n=1 Tax=Hyalangium minutum TaxID=394096 RepID=A0A085WXE1_9BACT|nr:tetratricopeptide repeat protein [Hyalangium minutum]KFE72354.1 tetratricopeptide repeat protein [Hyalangium minutum]